MASALGSQLAASTVWPESMRRTTSPVCLSLLRRQSLAGEGSGSLELLVELPHALRLLVAAVDPVEEPLQWPCVVARRSCAAIAKRSRRGSRVPRSDSSMSSTSSTRVEKRTFHSAARGPVLMSLFVVAVSVAHDGLQQLHEQREGLA